MAGAGDKIAVRTWIFPTLRARRDLFLTPVSKQVEESPGMGYTKGEGVSFLPEVGSGGET
jgi:hypothetical protein